MRRLWPLALLLLGGSAGAQNLEPFYYSDDASLTAGAATASTRDGGATWYNPAGLAAVHRAQVDLSGSTYGLRIRRVPGAIRSGLPGAAGRVDLDSFDIVSAPNAVSYVRAVSRKVSLAFGAFITQRDVRNGSQLVQQDVSQGSATGYYRQRVDATLDVATYHLGPAVGVELSPTLRLGFALLGSYTTQSSFFQYALEGRAASATTTGLAFGLSQVRGSFGGLGGQASVGLQWDFAAGWTLGAMLRSPQFLLSSWVNGDTIGLFASMVTGSGAGGQAVFNLAPASGSSQVELLAPPRLSLGMSRAFGDSYLALDVEGAPPLANPNRGIDRGWSINARLGGRWQATQRLALGLGLFTDLASQPLASAFAAERIDWFGGTLGLSLRTPLALVKNPRPDALVLVTTVSVRYAAGVGQFQGLVVDASTSATSTRAINVLYQEVVPYLGSALLF